MPKASLDTLDGTYSFCARCPSHSNCCVRVKPNGQISPPILLGEEIAAIAKHSNESPEAFSETREGSDETRAMKPSHHGCYFYRDGKCSIYQVRPLDCRLFPIDIMEKSNGSIVWIAYTQVCPVKFDIASCLEKAKRLLPELRNYVREYARAEAPWMTGEPYVELETISPPSEVTNPA